MNQTEMAEILGISPATVSRLCAGKRRPSIVLMDRIEDTMGWAFEKQADEVRCGSYASSFRQFMEGYPGGHAGT